MKRFFAVISALAILLSLFACGGKTTDDQNDGSTDGSSDSLSSDPSDIDSHTADHLKYEDLPRTETFVIWSEDDHPCIEIDYPDVRFDTHGNGMGSENSLDYSIVTVNAEQRMPDTSLDDAFMTLLNGEDGFHSVLKMVNRSSYADITPEKETVTLACGREAIGFSGIQPSDDYGTLTDCPIFGYCTFCNDIPVIVCCILFNPDNVGNEKLGELQHYVEEMINTARCTVGE